MAQEGTRAQGLALPPQHSPNDVAPAPGASRMLRAWSWGMPGASLPRVHPQVSPWCPNHLQAREHTEQSGWKIPPLPWGWQHQGGHRARVGSTQPLGCFGKVKGRGGRHGHPGTAGMGAWELWIPCPARRAVLFHLLCLPTLEFSFAPVIKTNGINPAAGTRLQGGHGRGWQRGRGGNRDPPNSLGCGTVALREILGLFPFLQCSALPNS